VRVLLTIGLQPRTDCVHRFVPGRLHCGMILFQLKLVGFLESFNAAIKLGAAGVNLGEFA
jgi:hypothetical protein